MSQSKRGKVRAQIRRREQVARELVRLRHRSLGCRYVGLESLRAEHELRLMNGETGVIDVHAAREHARSLIRGYADNDHARNMCTLGLRILGELEGQPDACQACKGEDSLRRFEVEGRYELTDTLNALSAMGWITSNDGGRHGEARCRSCRGSGHNLRGYLPPVEWSAPVRRKVADASRAVQHYDVRLAPWMRMVAESIGDSPSGSAGPWPWP